MNHTSARAFRPLRPAASCMACLLALLAAGQADAQTPAYVANANANAVSVLDTTSNAVTATISVGLSPADVVISQDATRAFVANTGSNSISVIDTATQSVVKTIPLGDSPASLAVSPTGNRLFVLGSSGTVRVIDTSTGGAVSSIAVGASDGQLALSPDGRHLYVAATNLTVIDTTTNAIIASCIPEVTAEPGVSNFAVSVTLSSGGTRAFVGVVSYSTDITGFRVDGSIAVVDTSTNKVTQSISLYSQPGPIAVTSDGSRLYVGIKSYWANTLYGAGFLPGRWTAVVDVATSAVVQWIDLGADGTAWAQQHTAAALALTPDRSGVYVAIPNGNTVAAIDTATNAIKEFIIVAGAPDGLAVAPSPGAKPKPVVDAVNDHPPIPVPALAGGRALASVLANDTIGGVRAAIGNVTLAAVSSTDASITLAADGSVWIAASASVGAHALVYQICDAANAQNCDRATVTVSVRPPFAIHANADSASAFVSSVAIGNVLANDTLDTAAATLSTVSLAQVSADAGLRLNAANGSVSVAAGVAAGPRGLSYRICERASPANCAVGSVVVTVGVRLIHAQADAAHAPRSGGTAIANVLANDTLQGAVVSLSKVKLTKLSSSTSSVALNVTTGAVTVTRGAPVGPQTIVYRICEAVSLQNCSNATVTVTVDPYVIKAVADSARASSKIAANGVANVLLNDTIGGVRATPLNVKAFQVSLTPANPQIRFNSTGTVDVLAPTTSGTYSLVYRICDLETAGNCYKTTLTLVLSGS